MRHMTPHSYYIRLALELDGELIEERFVEPNEIVFIGHEQRSTLLCWGRLPRRIQLFRYENGQPVVLIAPQWLTQHSSPRSVSPRSHPSSCSIPTPLLVGERFTLDLDGALLHIEHCPLDDHAQIPDVQVFEPRSGSLKASGIALASLAICSLLWAGATLSWHQVAPHLKQRHTSASRAPSPLTSPAAASHATAHTITPVQSSTGVGTSLPRIPVQQDAALSWQAREVQRLLQRRSEAYRACFGQTTPATSVVFELGISPTERQSQIDSVHASRTSGASDAIVSCLTGELRKAQLPHYQKAFAVQFHVIVDPVN